MQDETFNLVDKAVSGDKQALENLILSVEDIVVVQHFDTGLKSKLKSQ